MDDHQCNRSLVAFVRWSRSIPRRIHHGYEQVYSAPAAIWKYVHRIIAQRKYGIRIPAGHEVHHLNGNKRDNSPDNLLVVPREVHQRIHQEARRAMESGDSRPEALARALEMVTGHGTTRPTSSGPCDDTGDSRIAATVGGDGSASPAPASPGPRHFFQHGMNLRHSYWLQPRGSGGRTQNYWHDRFRQRQAETMIAIERRIHQNRRDFEMTQRRTARASLHTVHGTLAGSGRNEPGRPRYHSSGKCSRCGGTGFLPEYRHVEGGVCFRCEGAGFE